MLRKIIFRVGFCVLLLIVGSCESPQTSSLEAAVEVQSESEEVSSGSGSEVIISLGEKKLTAEQVRWMRPNADEQRIAELANWWLETELLYAEAEKRGITKEPRVKFISELKMKQNFAQELIAQVRDSVKISDEAVRAYYEENKETDFRLRKRGTLSFSHIRTKTLEEAQAALERIKAGEDINTLARELSIYKDGRKGGFIKKYVYKRVEGIFGADFFDALVAAEEGELIGPIKVKDGSYEVARQDGKVEPEILPFKKVRERIESQLLGTEQDNATIELLNSVKQEAADKVVKSPLIIQIETAAEERAKKAKENSKEK